MPFPSCLLLCSALATDSLLVLEVLFYTCPLLCFVTVALLCQPLGAVFVVCRALPFLHFAMKYEAVRDSVEYAFGLF